MGVDVAVAVAVDAGDGEKRVVVPGHTVETQMKLAESV
jgi:hypothetical protein